MKPKSGTRYGERAWREPIPGRIKKIFGRKIAEGILCCSALGRQLGVSAYGKIKCVLSTDSVEKLEIARSANFRQMRIRLKMPTPFRF